MRGTPRELGRSDTLSKADRMRRADFMEILGVPIYLTTMLEMRYLPYFRWLSSVGLLLLWGSQ